MASMLPPAMAYEFKLPDLGEGLTEGEIARWLVAEGQEIAEDDPLVEIQTDKTTVEIPSPAAGSVTRILAAEGDVVPVGTVIVVIGGERHEDRAPAEEATPTGRVRAPPHARRVAQQLGAGPARVEGDELVLLDRYDIGIAVQTEDGLVVPVVRGCDTASLAEIDAEVHRLADAARAGTLAPEELRGGTFTITSAGKHAGLLGTPLINPPQTGILGIHRI